MKRISLYIDITFCLVFLPLMIVAFPVERWWGTYPLFFSTFVAWLYVTYFVYRYIILPRLFHGRKRITAISAIVISLLITMLMASYDITSPFYHMREQCSPPFPVWGVRQNKQAIWLHYILVVTFCVAVGMVAEAYRQRLAREKVENERNKAELALYKAQTGPHFLFNTLNTIYGMLLSNSDKALTTFERFIRLTQYMYLNAGRDYITLAEESDYINQYIQLQQERLSNMAHVTFKRQICNEETLVPPMLFITFIENAFKYGISNNEPCNIYISLTDKADMVNFEVKNTIFRHSDTNSHGTGIDNCRRRLSILYPQRHNLECHACPDGTFIVKLSLHKKP